LNSDLFIKEFEVSTFINSKSSLFFMVKCDLCGQKLATTFLNKIIGTIIKDKDGKKKTICSDCQRNHQDLKSKI